VRGILAGMRRTFSHLVGGQSGEIDVDQHTGIERSRDQSGEHLARPGFGGGERHAVAHPLARIGLAERDRRDAGKCAFHRRRDGARISHVLGEVGAAVDPRQDQVGGTVLHDMRERHHHRVGRRAVDREPPLAQLAQAQRPGEGQRMPRARLFFGRRDRPNVIAKRRRDPFEQGESGRPDAVVIGEEYPHPQRMGEWLSNRNPCAFRATSIEYCTKLSSSVLVKLCGFN